MALFTTGLAVGAALGACALASLKVFAADVEAARNRALQLRLAETRAQLAHTQLRKSAREVQIARLARNLPLDYIEEEGS